MLVISDVYEYFVTRTVERLELEIRVFRKGTQYDNVFLVDSSGKRVEETKFQSTDAVS